MLVADIVLDILARVARTPDVKRDPDLLLYDRRVIDSLGTVELIVQLSSAFDLDISPAELDRSAWATPALVVTDIERRLAAVGRDG